MNDAFTSSPSSPMAQRRHCRGRRGPHAHLARRGADFSAREPWASLQRETPPGPARGSCESGSWAARRAPGSPRRPRNDGSCARRAPESPVVVRRGAMAAQIELKTKRPGDATHFARKGATCRIHYEGKLSDGTIFDSSRSAEGADLQAR